MTEEVAICKNVRKKRQGINYFGEDDIQWESSSYFTTKKTNKKQKYFY